MKKVLLLSFFLVSIIQTAYNQPVTFNWSNGMGGKANNGNSITTTRDAAGDLYIFGEFSGSRNFGSINLISIGSTDVFVAKYSEAGVCQWAIQGGFGFSYASSGEILVTGNTVYLVGTYYNAIQFGTIGVAGIGNSDIYIASLDASNGNPNWVQKAGGTYDELGIGISKVSGGGVFICGYFAGTATFGSYTISSANGGDYDMYIAKYDAAGNCLWVNRIGSGSGEDKALSVKEAPGGGIVFTGSFEGTVDFGSGVSLTSYGGIDYCLAKFNALGVMLWAVKGGGDNSDVGNSIEVDAGGFLYATGYIGDTATFGSITINNHQNVNMFVSKHDPYGTCLWVRQAGANSADAGYDISVDAGGSTYVTGYIEGNANFGTTNLTGVQGIDGFVAKYDPAGNLRWVTKIGGSGSDQGKSVISAADGYCYNAGEFEGTMTLGATPPISTASGTWATYLTKLGGGTVGLNENETNMFTVYPNPANDIISLDLKSIQDAIFTVDLVDMTGRVVQSRQLNQLDVTRTVNLETNQLKSGIYFLNISTSTGDYSKRVSIIHN